MISVEHTWPLANRTIELWRKEKTLVWRIRGESGEQPIVQNKYGIDETIRYLRYCIPSWDPTGAISFDLHVEEIGKWGFSDKEITLQKRASKLFYSILYLPSREKIPLLEIGDIQDPKKDVDFVSGMFPVFDAAGKMTFKKPEVVHDWRYVSVYRQDLSSRFGMKRDSFWKGKDFVMLFKVENQLFWRLSSLVRRHLLELLPSHFFGEFVPHSESLANRLLIADGSEGSRVDSVILNSVNKIVGIWSYAHSILRPFFGISQTNWVVTLIGAGSCKHQTDKCAGLIDVAHAELVIEGLNDDGQRVMRLLHFAHHEKEKRHKAMNHSISPSVFKYAWKGDTWKIDREQYEKLAARIEENPYPPFSKFGNGSIVAPSGAHSCITWVKEQLKFLGIELSEFTRQLLYTLPEDYKLN